MTAIPIITLENTFDEWRLRTNQLIQQYDETNILAANAYNAVNTASFTAANLAADVLVNEPYIINAVVEATVNVAPDIILSNTQIRDTIYASSNTITYGFLANLEVSVISDQANTAYDQANSAFDKANTGTGGYFIGNRGSLSNEESKGDIFRVNYNTLSANVTFFNGENASATGPLYIQSGSRIEIQTGARVVII